MEQPIYHLEHALKTKEERTAFDGPLDLILHLLSKNKMEIADIQISLILEQYLAWMEQRKELNLEVASEFITMASQLMFIKSRMLLNLHDEEAISEIDQLKAQLESRQRHENYLKIKAVAAPLLQRYLLGRDYISKGPEALPVDKDYPYHHRPEDLIRGLLTALSRGEAATPPPQRSFAAIVGKEPYPVDGKAQELQQLLCLRGRLDFLSLFHSCKSRSEMVATFLAVLELCKQCLILLEEQGDDLFLLPCSPESGESTISVAG